jgi:hypothetical protein
MRNKPNSRPRRAGRGRRDDDAKQTQFGPPTGRGRGVAGPIVPNKPNRPKRGRRGEPWGTRDEGHCTNKPNSCPYADSEIGVPGGTIVSNKPNWPEASVPNEPNSARLGQGQVPSGGKMRNEANSTDGTLGPAEPSAPNKANFPLDGVGRGRPTLDQVEGRLHEEPRAIVPNKANSRLRPVGPGMEPIVRNKPNCQRQCPGIEVER